jgi:hypothetical protein
MRFIYMASSDLSLGLASDYFTIFSQLNSVYISFLVYPSCMSAISQLPGFHYNGFFLMALQPGSVHGLLF